MPVSWCSVLFVASGSVKGKQNGANHRSTDHCIDTIRLALMCHGDIAVVTFGWEDGEVLPSPDFNIQHECRNWDNLLEWAKPRKADMSQVVRPQ